VIEALILLAAILFGGLILAAAMQMAYRAGQQFEESKGRRYLETLSHLNRRNSPE